MFRLGEDSSLVLATVGFGADAKDIAETMRRAVDVLIPLRSSVRRPLIPSFGNYRISSSSTT